MQYVEDEDCAIEHASQASEQDREPASLLVESRPWPDETKTTEPESSEQVFCEPEVCAQEAGEPQIVEETAKQGTAEQKAVEQDHLRQETIEQEHCEQETSQLEHDRGEAEKRSNDVAANIGDISSDRGSQSRPGSAPESELAPAPAVGAGEIVALGESLCCGEGPSSSKQIFDCTQSNVIINREEASTTNKSQQPDEPLLPPNLTNKFPISQEAPAEMATQGPSCGGSRRHENWRNFTSHIPPCQSSAPLSDREEQLPGPMPHDPSKHKAFLVVPATAQVMGPLCRVEAERMRRECIFVTGDRPAGMMVMDAVLLEFAMGRADAPLELQADIAMGVRGGLCQQLKQYDDMKAAAERRLAEGEAPERRITLTDTLPAHGRFCYCKMHQRRLNVDEVVRCTGRNCEIGGMAHFECVKIGTEERKELKKSGRDWRCYACTMNRRRAVP